MKVCGVGIDFEPVVSFRRKNASSGRLLQRVFSERELAYCRKFRDPAIRLAARFCAKEAAVKAIRPHLPVTVFDFEVQNDSLGAPRIRPRSSRMALRRFFARHDLFVSLTHTDDLAAAVAILVRKGKAP